MNENDRAFVDSLHHMLQVAIDTTFVALFGVVIIALLTGTMAGIYYIGLTIDKKRQTKNKKNKKGDMTP